MYMRSLMNLEMSTADLPPFDPSAAMSMVKEGLTDAYLQYIKTYNENRVVLPRMLISLDCPVLIEAIPKAIHSPEDPNDIDPTHFKGMDSLDSVRYLVGGMRDDPGSTEPVNVARAREMASALSSNPNLTFQDLVWIARERGYDSPPSSSEGFSIRRQASSRSRFLSPSPDQL